MRWMAKRIVVHWRRVTEGHVGRERGFEMAELKRSEIGNAATEQGAFERGADPGSIGVSTLPEPREHLEVDAEVVEDGLYIEPTSPGRLSFDLAHITEGPLTMLEHELTEDPDFGAAELRRVNGVEVAITPWRASEVSRRGAREALIWYACTPDMAGAVLGDRVDVLKDILESSYSCKSCRGRGHLESDCGNCRGTKYERAKDDSAVPCRACVVLGFGMELRHSSGKRVCDSCGGSGWKNGIVVPDAAQKEAVTGIVVSVGPDCKLLKLGDRVLHSRYAGHELKIGENNTIVTMRESEVLKILREIKECH
jgi:co-chaperonin GroES (HSP10)